MRGSTQPPPLSQALALLPTVVGNDATPSFGLIVCQT